MPITTADGQPAQINPDQMIQWQATERAALEAQHAALEHDASVIIWGVLLATVLLAAAYSARHAARRRALAGLRVVDRAAYALGIDSRRIAARWRERGSC